MSEEMELSPEEREPELWQAPVIVLDDVAHTDEALVVVVNELLVLRVLQVVLGHRVHVVEPEELVLGLEEAPHRGVPGEKNVSIRRSEKIFMPRDHVSQLQSVLDLVDAIGAGPKQHHGEDDGEHLEYE